MKWQRKHKEKPNYRILTKFAFWPVALTAHIKGQTPMIWLERYKEIQCLDLGLKNYYKERKHCWYTREIISAVAWKELTNIMSKDQLECYLVLGKVKNKKKRQGPILWDDE